MNEVGGKLIDKVDQVIGCHAVYNLMEFAGGESLNDAFLCLLLQIGEDFSGIIAVDGLEEEQKIFLRQAFQCVSDIGRVIGFCNGV